MNDRIISPRANTQPIYPRVPLFWRAKLTTQAVGFSPSSDPVSASPSRLPVLLGTGGDNGAILDSYHIASVYEPPSGGGGSSGGGGTANIGPVGTGLAGNPVTIRFFSRIFGTDELVYIAELPLDPNARWTVSGWGYPILPQPQVAFRLAPQEELFVGLNRAVPGVWVGFRGGYY